MAALAAQVRGHLGPDLRVLAERALLQQPIRERQRRQDVYDLNLLIRGIKLLGAAEKMQLLNLLIGSCKEREIDAKKTVWHLNVNRFYFSSQLQCYC